MNDPHCSLALKIVPIAILLRRSSLNYTIRENATMHEQRR
jgi:hypothetical protein